MTYCKLQLIQPLLAGVPLYAKALPTKQQSPDLRSQTFKGSLMNVCLLAPKDTHGPGGEGSWRIRFKLVGACLSVETEIASSTVTKPLKTVAIFCYNSAILPNSAV